VLAVAVTLGRVTFVAAGAAAWTEVGGATTAGRAATGGADFAAASACFRSRIAFKASPGLETFERSNFGLLSLTGFDADVLRDPPVR
jgi:hypothetical protein